MMMISWEWFVYSIIRALIWYLALFNCGMWFTKCYYPVNIYIYTSYFLLSELFALYLALHFAAVILLLLSGHVYLHLWVVIACFYQVHNVQVSICSPIRETSAWLCESSIEHDFIAMAQLVQGGHQVVHSPTWGSQVQVRGTFIGLLRLHFNIQFKSVVIVPSHGLPSILNPHDEAFPVLDCFLQIDIVAGGAAERRAGAD